MKERFLHFVWNYQLLNFQNLVSEEGNPIQIINKGTWNQSEAGADFLNAQLKINQTIWAGNIEIHVRSSDWDSHQHSRNLAYYNTILHIVFEHDREIDFLKLRHINTLELRKYIPDYVIYNYKSLLNSKEQFIPCENQISQIQPEIMNVWKESLMIQRLQRKVLEIQNLYQENQKNWEKLLFKQLAHAFGLKINSEAFLIWANSFDFKVLQKVQHNPNYVRALFYGQAGFLEINSQDEFICELQKDYEFLQRKFQLTPVPSSIFKFFRLRPPNFPTIRIAQLAEIYINYSSLFGLFVGSKSISKLKTIFTGITLPKFWDNHFTFQKESTQTQSKKISNELIDRMLINVILPIKFTYAQSVGVDLGEEVLDLLAQISPEKNTTVEQFLVIGVKSKNALETQALLELKKQYCEPKNCLNCTIGLQIIKNA